MTSPLLSICIPTYNREPFLRECLRSLENEWRSDFDLVIEIVISDNASTDNSIFMLNEFRDVLPVSLIVQEKNIGADANFSAVVELARGEYCWLLGSDDVVNPGALDKLLVVLQKECKDIIHFGYTQTDIALKYLHEVHPPPGPVRSGAKGLIDYFGELPNLSLLFTFISSFVFRRSLWVDRIGFIQAWIGTHYVHAFIMHTALGNGASLFAMNDCLISARGGNANDINSIPGRFIELDAGTVMRFVYEIYMGNKNFLNAIGRPFRRSYPPKTIIRVASTGGLYSIIHNKENLLSLGYPVWLFQVLFCFHRLRVLKLIGFFLSLRSMLLQNLK